MPSACRPPYAAAANLAAVLVRRRLGRSALGGMGGSQPRMLEQTARFDLELIHMQSAR